MQRSALRQILFGTLGCAVFGLLIWLSIWMDLGDDLRAGLAVLVTALGLFFLVSRVGIVSWASATVLFWLALTVFFVTQAG